MDLLTLRTEIRARLGEDEEDFWSDAFLNRQINQAVKRFSIEEKWPWLYTEATTTVNANQSLLAMNTDVSLNRHFSLAYTVTGETALRVPKRVGPAEGRKLRRRYSTPGSEVFWYYHVSTTTTASGNSMVVTPSIRLIPTPNRALNVEVGYIRVPADLVNDTDVPEVPEEYQECILSWATAMAWLRELRARDKAQEQFELYAAVLAQAKADLNNLPIDTSLAVGAEEPTGLPIRDPLFGMQLPLG